MKIQITLSELVHTKVKYWVDKANKEVSGFGTTTLTKTEQGYDIYVHDAYLLEQEVGAAHTDIDAASLGKLMHKILSNPETRSLRLNWWWHSHVQMKTFWSSTDVDTIKSIGKNGLCVASVFNQQGDIRSAVCYKTNNDIFGEDCTMIDEVPTFCEVVEDERVIEWNEEFDRCVKSPSPSPYYAGDEEFDRCVKSPSPSPYYAGDEKTWDEYQREYNNKRGESERQYSLLTSAHKYTDEKNLVDILEHGLLGFGVDDEAKALGIKPKAYRRILKDNKLDEIRALEYKLELKYEEGGVR